MKKIITNSGIDNLKKPLATVDEMVYKLYGPSEDEIAIAEGNR